MLHVWNIYLHLPQKSPSDVGKYSSTMEHLGIDIGESFIFNPLEINTDNDYDPMIW